jgi:hypothetical protein
VTALNDNVADLADLADLAHLEGCAVLDAVADFLARFIAYPSDHARFAHALWLAHTWRMDEWESTPRLAFMSPEKGSGKTRALEVSQHLVPRGVRVSQATTGYILAKVSQEQPVEEAGRTGPWQVRTTPPTARWRWQGSGSYRPPSPTVLC